MATIEDTQRELTGRGFARYLREPIRQAMVDHYTRKDHRRLWPEVVADYFDNTWAALLWRWARVRTWWRGKVAAVRHLRQHGTWPVPPVPDVTVDWRRFESRAAREVREAQEQKIRLDRIGRWWPDDVWWPAAGGYGGGPFAAVFDAGDSGHFRAEVVDPVLTRLPDGKVWVDHRRGDPAIRLGTWGMEDLLIAAQDLTIRNLETQLIDLEWRWKALVLKNTLDLRKPVAE